MIERRLIDTNLILRFLVQDNERHARAAGKLFAACDRGETKLVLLPVVLAECVFVLESFYKHQRGKIAAALSTLVSSPGIELDHLHMHLDALDRYHRTRLHFVNCTIAAAEDLRVATLDQDFKKFADVTVDLE